MGRVLIAEWSSLCQLKNLILMKLALPKLNDVNREFLFTERDFEHIRKLIYDHAGINLSAAKKDLVYSRLGRR